MIEIINNLILLAQYRNQEPTILRLDSRSYNEFKQELTAIMPATNFIDKVDFEKYTYMGVTVEIRLDRESWINKIYIEIE